MKNKIVFNAVMIFFIIVAIICCFVLMGNFGGWFTPPNYYSVSAAKKNGSVSIIRRGTGYTLKEGAGFIAGDSIETVIDSSAVLTVDGKSTLAFWENSGAEMNVCEPDNTRIEINKGSVFIVANGLKKNAVFEIVVGSAVISVKEDTVFSAEVFAGTQTVNIYSGSAEFKSFEAHEILRAGSSAVILQNEDGESSVSFNQFSKDCLSEFLITEAIQAGKSHILCNSNAELQTVLDFRAQEVSEEKAARKEYEEKLIAQGGNIPVVNRKNTANHPATPGNKKILTCTVEIRCDTILDNMSNLKEGKAKYVPKNGVILTTTKVEFVEGENVYNVLKRACGYFKIPIEYRWYVEYGGYYMEGINNLFEFDCGKSSGWMYKVNGWYPNYGCWNYVLKENDVIVWNYTCNLGKDLGASIQRKEGKD